jgi:hypothetical protein
MEKGSYARRKDGEREGQKKVEGGRNGKGESGGKKGKGETMIRRSSEKDRFQKFSF